MRCYATETMTCVYRYTGSVVKINGKSFCYAAYRDGTTDNLYITVSWRNQDETADIRNYLNVSAAGTRYSFTDMDGWDDPVCRISAGTDPTSIMIMKRISMDSMTNGALTTDGVRVYPGQYTTLPVLTMNVVLYANHSQTLTWSLQPGDNRNGWGTAMELWQKAPGGNAFAVTALFSEEQRTSYRLTTGADLLGKDTCLMLEYRTYAADWDGKDLENFVTLNRMVTALQTVNRDAAIPLAPGGITTTMLLDGGKVTVSWPDVVDPVNAITGYILERAVAAADGTAGDTSGYVRLYAGPSPRFRDTLPEGMEIIRYRVCAVNAAGTQSPWTDSGPLAVVKSNIYTAVGGRWIRAAAVWVGGRKASPMAKVR